MLYTIAMMGAPAGPYAAQTYGKAVVQMYDNWCKQQSDNIIHGKVLGWTQFEMLDVIGDFSIATGS
jgi:hypothetical protein